LLQKFLPSSYYLNYNRGAVTNLRRN
jgi:hypothetical protein